MSTTTAAIALLREAAKSPDASVTILRLLLDNKRLKQEANEIRGRNRNLLLMVAEANRTEEDIVHEAQGRVNGELRDLRLLLIMLDRVNAPPDTNPCERVRLLARERDLAIASKRTTITTRSTRRKHG
jgi:hypothetical protein